ncbi:MAG: protease complex subunit PrcB family protein [Bacteroidales bacterium]|jgi:hypothetical protein|nr:protease complex subunit PrcB family protein [Bacteroidales bacterium]
MKRIILFIAASLVLLSARAQITQSESDSIALQRMSKEAREYTLFAQKNVQTDFTITTSVGEVLKLDYPCWVYYVNYIEQTDNHLCRYLIVKESNGNLLEVKTKNNAEPSDLTAWRTIPEEPLDTFVLIAQGVLYGNGREGITKQNSVITTATDWEDLQTAMNSINNVTDSFTETNIDFSKYQIIAVFDNIRFNDGWTIAITDIIVYRDSIVVTIQNIEKGNTDFIITQPYYIVKIPLSEIPIIFHDETISSNILIAKGNLSGSENIPKQNIVIETQITWHSLINAMDTINNVSDNFAETAIDFSRDQVIAIFDILKVNGGWSINITDIMEYENKIVITIQNVETGDSTVVITRPYYIVKIPITGKNIVFHEETSDEEPKLECDCKNELFYYYQENKVFLDTLFLNDYLLVACDTLIQNTEMVNYINQIDLFNLVNINKILYTDRGDYHLLFVNTKIKRSCSQLKAIISFLENNPLIAYSNLTFDTDAWFSGIYMDIMFYDDTFIACLKDTNDLSDLNLVLQETNTRIKKQDQYNHKKYLISADKNSNSNALEMANYFYETGKFVFAEPNLGWTRINR